MILSLDAATKKTGYAILDKDGKLVNCGLIRTQSDNYISRIEELYKGINEIIESFDIENIVLEDVPINKNNNLRTGKELSVLQGMILSLSFKYNITIKLYNPSAWRSIIGMYNGTRESTKRDYQKQAAVDKVNSIYDLGFVYNATETKTRSTDDDKAEAICLGLAYINDNK